MLGVYLQRSTVLLAATGVPLAVVYAFSERLLVLLGESERIAAAAAVFVYGLIPQIFAYAANFPIQKFLQAQSIVAPSAYISSATLLLHLALSWVAVYKMGLGLLGASLVLSLSWWITVAAQFEYIVTSPRCRETWTGFTVQAFSGLYGFFKLSAASAVMLCLETWYFQILVLIAGLLKNPELSLVELNLNVFFPSLLSSMTVNGWVFMISVGFNAAAKCAHDAAVLTSFELTSRYNCLFVSWMQRAGGERVGGRQPEGGGVLGGGRDVALARRVGGVRRRRALPARPAELLLHRRRGHARGVRPLSAPRRHHRSQRRPASPLR
jgi:hypothetical protein